MREVAILAGGQGTRLREIIPDLPKPMAPVCNRPFLEILLLSLAKKGVTRVVISVGFMAEKIVTYFGDHFAGMTITYVVEDAPLGTGGATRLALSSCVSDHVVVMNGDTFLDLEMDEIDRIWRKRGKPIIVGTRQDDASRYGRLVVEQGRLLGFVEKGASGPGIINGGCYVFNRAQFASYPSNKAFSLESEFMAELLKSTSVDVFISNGLFIDIGIPDDYLIAQTKLAHLA